MVLLKRVKIVRKVLAIKNLNFLIDSDINKNFIATNTVLVLSESRLLKLSFTIFLLIHIGNLELFISNLVATTLNIISLKHQYLLMGYTIL